MGEGETQGMMKRGEAKRERITIRGGKEDKSSERREKKYEDRREYNFSLHP